MNHNILGKGPMITFPEAFSEEEKERARYALFLSGANFEFAQALYQAWSDGCIVIEDEW
jgi:hypothetical protein